MKDNCVWGGENHFKIAMKGVYRERLGVSVRKEEREGISQNWGQGGTEG